MKKASVVMPAYNEERWIGAALESLVGQTHPDYEIVVVDDGSSDATAEIASTFPVGLVRGDHLGEGAARDRGARATTGDVLVFVDADELYAPDFLERLCEPLEDPDVRATFPGGMEWHNLGEGLAAAWLHLRTGSPYMRPPRFGDSNGVVKALRREDFDRVGGYPTAGYGVDQIFGRLAGPALVVHEARCRFTLPTGPAEIFGKARWIGRGPLFASQRPPLWKLLPPVSWWRAAKLLAAGHPRTAWVRVLYDAGTALGFAESKLRPNLRHVA
jgi:glycosyltransferase involved in cell wall biosynthesis